MLAAEIETVCRHYLPNGRRNGHYWEVGSIAGESGSSLKVNLAGPRRGWWTDWANPTDRGDALDLIRTVREFSSIGEAAREARSFLALPEDARPRCGPPPKACAPASQTGLERVLAGARRIVPEDAAGRYLSGRGLDIEDARAAALRFRPDTWVQVDGAKREMPALLAPIRAVDGTLEGMQRIFLTEDGRKAPISGPKRTSGRLFTGAVRWPAVAASHLVLTEGVEDALAICRALGPARRQRIAIVAAISSGRVHQVGLPAGIERVTLVQDRDPAGEHSWVALCRQLAEAGVLANRIIPREKDANDELLALGPARFLARLASEGLIA